MVSRHPFLTWWVGLALVTVAWWIILVATSFSGWPSIIVGFAIGFGYAYFMGKVGFEPWETGR